MAACAGGSETSGSAESAAANTEAVFPATVTHKFGTTTVSAPPERVVVVGLVEQDALLALGVVPVATSEWYSAPGGVFPWATSALGDGSLPTVLDNSSDGVPFEQVAALGPDLIIAVYSGLSQTDYDLLTKIAPVVAQPGDYVDYGAPWDEVTLTVSAAVGKPATGQALVDGVKEEIATAGRELAGGTGAIVSPYEGIYVFGPEDPRGRLLQELGFAFPPALLQGRPENSYGWSLSAERASDLKDLDVVIWLDTEQNVDSSLGKVWTSTDANIEGRDIYITPHGDAVYDAAFNMVTPLSLPYALDRLLPQLQAAADGEAATKVPA
jgi:iron complex transport system substrate-binding protein